MNKFFTDKHLNLADRKMLAYTWLALGGRIEVDGIKFQTCKPDKPAYGSCGIDDCCNDGHPYHDLEQCTFNEVRIRKLSEGSLCLLDKLINHIFQVRESKTDLPKIPVDENGNVIWERG